MNNKKRKQTEKTKPQYRAKTTDEILADKDWSRISTEKKQKILSIIDMSDEDFKETYQYLD